MEESTHDMEMITKLIMEGKQRGRRLGQAQGEPALGLSLYQEKCDLDLKLAGSTLLICKVSTLLPLSWTCRFLKSQVLNEVSK